MTDELYYEMFREWKKSGSSGWLHHDIYKANDQVKKYFNRKHLWIYKKYSYSDHPPITFKYFSSREKAARYWALTL